MMSLRKASPLFLFLWGALSFSTIASAAPPQAGAEVNWSSRPEANRVEESVLAVNLGANLAEPPVAWPQAEPGARKRRFGGQRGSKGANGPSGAHGLQPTGNGTVYDSNLGVYWLADANLAGDAQVREMLGATKLKINADGSMDYATALEWVQALNNFNHGQGYLGHNNWQLPVTPQNDKTCSAHKVGSFGATCTGSALGNLYQVGLGLTFPNNVAPDFSATIPPFENMQPALYWTTDKNNGGEVTFSFLTNIKASNTPQYNYMHVLATIPGAINGQAPAGSGVVAYTSGTAKGKAVYDSNVPGGRTWLLDANLARSQPFALKGKTTTITSKLKRYPPLTVPLIDNGGAMLFETTTANDPKTGWIAALNHDNYGGAGNWAIPSYDDLRTLFKDLKLQPHDTRLLHQGNVGPFQHLQPFFYWACQRDQTGTSVSPCNPDLNPPPTGDHPMAWSFNFDNGFQGTSDTIKPFFVMVYYTPQAPKCSTPIQCCIQAGGTWSGGRCQ